MTIKHRIVLSLLTENEAFQREQAVSARDAAAREGFELDVVWADNNPLNQIQQLYRAVNAPDAARPTAIIAQAVATEGVEGAARVAVEKGIGWVLLSDPAPSFEALHAQHPARLLSCIYVDNEALGRLQGDLVKRLLPAGGSVVCIEGPPMSSAAKMRREGLERALSVGTNVKLARTLSADWTGATAERLAAGWLRHASDAARPDLFVAQNDEMAEGVLRALAKERPQWGAIPVTGCDGLEDAGLALVRAGTLAATIVIPPRGGLAVEAVARHLRGEAVPFSTAVTAELVFARRS